ncbi:MAG: hypothetical protein AAF569_00665 [Pseudomonadota bacterium]
MKFLRLGTLCLTTALMGCAGSGYKGPTDFRGGTQEDTLRGFNSDNIDLERLQDLQARMERGQVDAGAVEREIAEITGVSARGIRDFLVRGVEEELNFSGYTLNPRQSGRYELLSDQDRCTVDGAVDKTMFYLPDIISQAVSNALGENVVILDQDNLVSAFTETETTCARNYGEIGVPSLNAQEIGDIALNKAVLSLVSVLVTDSVESAIVAPRRELANRL